MFLLSPLNLHPLSFSVYAKYVGMLDSVAQNPNIFSPKNNFGSDFPLFSELDDWVNQSGSYLCIPLLFQSPKHPRVLRPFVWMSVRPSVRPSIRLRGVKHCYNLAGKNNSFICFLMGFLWIQQAENPKNPWTMIDPICSIEVKKLRMTEIVNSNKVGNTQQYS